MLNVVRSSHFRRDIKLAQRRRWDMKKLAEVIALLASGQVLSARHKDHPLSGSWQGYRDCHVEGDWILIYWIAGSDLYLARTGTHSDIFG